MKLTKYLAFVVSALLVLPLTGCSSDDDTGGSAEYSVAEMVGEWFVEMDVDNNVDKEVVTFTLGNGGAYDVVVRYCSKNEGYKDEFNGTYTVSGNKLKTEYDLYGERFSSEYQIRKVGKYDMMLFLTAMQVEEIDHRIVDTWNLKVGQTDDVFVNDPEFFAEEYTSNDEKVAAVSSTGTVTALRQGTAYISATSSVGTAVTRVVVEDPNTYIDNFMNYFGESVDVATHAYGNLYDEQILKDNNNLMMRHYYLTDDKIHEVGFSYNENGIVEDIRVVIRDDATINTVLDTFANLYDFIAQSDNKYYFRTTKNARSVSVSFDMSRRFIQYEYESANDPFAVLDGLIYNTATEIAAKIGHEITNEERQNGQFISVLSNSTYDAIAVYFDGNTDVVSNYRLHFNSSVGYEEVYQWYSHHYLETGLKEIKFFQMNPLVYISVDIFEKDGHVYVVYLPGY